MRPIVISMAPSATSTNAICLSQTPGGAGNLTLNGALVTAGVAILGAQTQVTITSAADISNRTFTLTGTDTRGFAVSESLTGPNATTVTSTKSYKTVTQIAISGAAAGAVTVGVNGVGVSVPVAMDIHQNGFSAALGLDITGTINVTVQHTFEDPFSSTFNAYTATWLDHSSLASKTADTDGNYAFPCRAVRLKVNSSSSGSCVFTIIQSGIHS